MAFRTKNNVKETDYTDLEGERFGEWQVLEFIGHVHPETEKYYMSNLYLCLCSCGNQGYVTRHSLQYGNSKSCGCKRGVRATDKPSRQVAMSSRYGSYDEWEAAMQAKKEAKLAKEAEAKRVKAERDEYRKLQAAAREWRSKQKGRKARYPLWYIINNFLGEK